MDNLDIYNALKQPPKEALRNIEGGRLAGKTDINPQWRCKAMTEQFGVCGIGWKFEVAKAWCEPANDSQVFVFAEIHLFVKQDGEWSSPIPGFGGSMLVEKEKAGLHANDEGYKMAITDALSTAMKMLGVAADVYAGLWDGAKYRDSKAEPKKKEDSPLVKEAKEMGATEPIINAGEFLTRALNEFKLNKTEVEKIVGKVSGLSDFNEAWIFLQKNIKEQ